MCDHCGVQQVEEMKQKLEQQLRVTEQLEKKQVKCIDMIRKLLLEKVCLELQITYDLSSLSSEPLPLC